MRRILIAATTENPLSRSLNRFFKTRVLTLKKSFHEALLKNTDPSVLKALRKK
ncbi:MAG: hypothetical protein H7A38_05595 [Chlamydiales bacterium]|nr:hypothetical protein [Chlamydiales bacterium]